MNLKLMKIIKYVILIVIILIICIIGFFLLKNKGKIGEDRSATPSTHIEAVENYNKIEKISNKNDYYIVKNCLNVFYIDYSQIYENTKSSFKLESDKENVENLKKQNIQTVYNILDEDYIKENNITLNNLETKLKKINKVSIDIANIYVYTKNENIKVYFVYGNLIDSSTHTASDFKIMLKVDTLNRTFNVLLQDYVEKYYNDIKVGEQINVNISNSIENKKYNVYTFENMTDEEYLKEIFTNCKLELLYNPESIYNKFSDEYKLNRFTTISELKKYVEENKTDIAKMQLAKYQKNVYEDYTEYICLDNNNKYYVIEEKELLDYTISLDLYTINTSEFKSKYDKADNKIKVGYNLEKIRQSINEKNYKYMYNKLNNEFKQKNYSNYDEFEKYMKNNLFESNKFEYESINEENSIFIAKINISDNSNIEQEIKKLNIIMQLNNDYDFEISFSFE